MSGRSHFLLILETSTQCHIPEGSEVKRWTTCVQRQGDDDVRERLGEQRCVET